MKVHASDGNLFSQKMSLTTPRGQAAEGTLRLLVLSQKSRIRRALKAWVLAWLAAVISVVIPLLHFVLVPGLLLAGPIIGWWYYHTEQMILGISARCPACQNEFKLEGRVPNWPLHDVCSHCRDAVTVSPTAAPEPLPN